MSAINIIFDKRPGPDCQFVEVENDKGKSITIGEWKERPDGLWALRIEERELGLCTLLCEGRL